MDPCVVCQAGDVLVVVNEVNVTALPPQHALQASLALIHIYIHDLYWSYPSFPSRSANGYHASAAIGAALPVPSYYDLPVLHLSVCAL